VGLRSIVVGSAGFGATMVGLAFVPDVAFAYPVVALVGATSVAYMTATTAIAQLRADRQMVGRVLALRTVLLIGTTPVGGPILGVVSDAAGGRAPVLIGGVAALAASALGSIAGWRRPRKGTSMAKAEIEVRPPRRRRRPMRAAGATSGLPAAGLRE
jgi:MFS family permease